jgi:hypothetical protein
LRETTEAELIDAVERMDAGVRLAVPQFAEAVGIGRTEHWPAPSLRLLPEPEEVDEELLVAVAADVAEFRDRAFRKLRHLEKGAPRHVHIEALAIVASLDDFLMSVAEYVGGDR